MKQFIVVISIILLLYSLIGCGKSSEKMIDDQFEPVSDTFDESSDPAPLSLIWPSFASLEEFLHYLETLEERDVSEDVAELASLEKYYLPTGIPDSYKIYRIIATPTNIGFWYLPEEYLKSDVETLLAESLRKNYLFFFSRDKIDAPIAGIMEQYGATESDLIDGRYLNVKISTNMLIWEEDGAAMWLYLPRMITTEFGEEEPPIDIDTIHNYCKLEVVYVN